MRRDLTFGECPAATLVARAAGEKLLKRAHLQFRTRVLEHGHELMHFLGHAMTQGLPSFSVASVIDRAGERKPFLRKDWFSQRFALLPSLQGTFGSAGVTLGFAFASTLRDEVALETSHQVELFVETEPPLGRLNLFEFQATGQGLTPEALRLRGKRSQMTFLEADGGQVYLAPDVGGRREIDQSLGKSLRQLDLQSLEQRIVKFRLSRKVDGRRPTS